MENYLLTALGIFVSIFLYILGYRQTIGAKKERIKAANLEVERILIRRIVTEKYDLSLIDITRLLEGKARDFKVKMSDLYIERQILNCIYTRILETDFITQEQREEILGRIIPFIDQADTTVVEDEHKTSYIQSFIALVSSILGGVLTVYLSFETITETEDLSNILLSLGATITVSLLLITFISILRRFKESQQEVNISDKSLLSMENAIKFEREVAKVISTRFPNDYSSSGDVGYDFLINTNQKKILVEVKAWSKPTNAAIRRLAARLNEIVISENANEAIIVTKKPVDHISFSHENNKVKIMSLNEFNRFIKSY